jgi:hypothetical protein
MKHGNKHVKIGKDGNLLLFICKNIEYYNDKK